MNEVFELNPQLDKVYTTSDGECFYNENDAKNYAKNLDVKTVETVYNEKFLEVTDEEVISDDDAALAEFEASEKAKADEEAKAKEDADAQAKANEEAKAKDTTDAQAKADEEAKVKEVIKLNTKK